MAVMTMTNPAGLIAAAATMTTIPGSGDVEGSGGAQGSGDMGGSGEPTDGDGEPTDGTTVEVQVKTIESELTLPVELSADAIDAFQKEQAAALLEQLDATLFDVTVTLTRQIRRRRLLSTDFVYLLVIKITQTGQKTTSTDSEGNATEAPPALPETTSLVNIVVATLESTDIEGLKGLDQSVLNAMEKSVSVKVTSEMIEKPESESEDLDIMDAIKSEGSDDESSSSSGGLSGGAIAGIVIGVLLGIGIIIFLVYYYTMSNKKTKRKSQLELANKGSSADTPGAAKI
eukprot:TRINITY_DN2956_c1_g1_i1.p1 TRINITY_DN2956_c1_g1~~TRINITY_DN2956_c1_g1_i1.p1  ORF type:complete len:287 (-),score=49.70 TRINITY_DN2956_c1_g1_i1:152-1012(-)